MKQSDHAGCYKS